MEAIVNVALTARSEEELLSGAAAEVARHLRADQFAVPTESKSGTTQEQPVGVVWRRALLRRADSAALFER